MKKEPLQLRFNQGTHRIISPEQTLAWITPLLDRFGITRLADISGLDENLGVPTYTAVRPTGLALQTGNRKGLTQAAAKASALMEAIELYHAENPEEERFLRQSRNGMRNSGLETLVPKRSEVDRRIHFSPERVIDWVEAEELTENRKVWVPACAAWFIEPSIYRTTTNGLASGNHQVEASLHALYELIERDAISRLGSEGVLDLKKTCRIIDLATVADEALQAIFAAIHEAGSKLVLLWVPTRLPVHVCWAVLLNHRPFRAVSAFNPGYGAHPSLEVAAARAVTEAIQSRLTLIQAAREDIIEKPSFSQADTREGPAFRYFDNLAADTAWGQLDPLVPDTGLKLTDPRARLTLLVEALAKEGHGSVIRVSLERPELRVPVVKLIVPSLAFRRDLF